MWLGKVALRKWCNNQGLQRVSPQLGLLKHICKLCKRSWLVPDFQWTCLLSLCLLYTFLCICCIINYDVKMPINVWRIHHSMLKTEESHSREAFLVSSNLYRCWGQLVYGSVKASPSQKLSMPVLTIMLRNTSYINIYVIYEGTQSNKQLVVT